MPGWFVAASAPEPSSEAESLSTDQRESAWSVGAFIYWFHPDERVSWWWGAETVNADEVRICLVSVEVLFPHEAYEWLMRAAGCQVVADEDTRELMSRQGERPW